MGRVMLFNGADWAPLDWDAPATDVSIDRTLNGATIITAQFPADYNAMMFGGYPLAYRNMAHMVVEDDRGGVWGGVVKESPLTDGLEVVAYGHSIHAKDMPWQGSRQQWINVDCVTGFRRVWDNILENNNIPRLQVNGITSSGVRVGEPADPGWTELTRRINQAKKFVDRRDRDVAYWERLQRSYARNMFKASGRSKVGEVVLKNGKVELEDAGTNKAVIEYEGNSEYNIQAVSFWNWTGVGAGHWARRGTREILDWARKWISANRSKERAEERYPTYEIRMNDLIDERDEKFPDGGEAEPYELSWWGNRDLSRTLEELADLGGFYWYDSGRWVGDEFHPTIELSSGNRAVREDIHLEIGVNVPETPGLTPGDVATHVTAIGSGEGAKTIRATRSMSHDRLVPVHWTISDKDLRTQQLANRAADSAMDRSRRALTPQLEGLTVLDHPMAPLSSFRLADRVRLVGELPDGSDLEAIVMVTGLEHDLSGDVVAVEVEGV